MSTQNPAHQCQAGTGRCELTTITASQLSAAAILFFYVVFRVYFVASSDPDPLAIQVTVASAATILYIFLCFWLVEDKLIDVLRDLRRPFAWGEFTFRVTLLIVLALMPTFIETWIPQALNGSLRIGTVSTKGADYVVVFLAVLFLMFLLWDSILYFGAPADPKAQKSVRKIARSYYLTDLLGFGILLLVEVSRFINTSVASILLILFILYSARQVAVVAKEMWASHFSIGLGRKLLR